MQIFRRISFCVVCLTFIWLVTFQQGLSLEGDSPSGATKPAPKAPADHHDHDHSHSHVHPHEHSHGHSHHHDHSHTHDNGHSHAHSHGHDSSKDIASHSLYGLPVWAKALISVGLISSAPNAVLFLIQVENSAQFAPRLRMMLAFAAGALLGDAFLHLIPHSLHAFSEAAEASGADAEHAAEASGTRVGLWVLCGILAFLGVELVVHALKQLSGHSHSHSHTHGHSRQDSARSSTSHADESASDCDTHTSPADNSKASGVRRRRTSKPRTKSPNRNASTADKDSTSTSTSSDTKEPAAKPAAVAAPQPKADWRRMLSGMRASGWLNLAADFTHNSTDGLAVGAAFLVNDSVGITVSLAILVHELPHELADLAILIQAGCSKRTAIMLQLTTAVGAFCGCGVALLLGAGQSESAAGSAWVLPFTAGGFIYIAMVTILPDLLEPVGPHGGLRGVLFAVLELSLILLGLAAMYVVGLFEIHEH